MDAHGVVNALLDEGVVQTIGLPDGLINKLRSLRSKNAPNSKLSALLRPYGIKVQADLVVRGKHVEAYTDLRTGWIVIDPSILDYPVTDLLAIIHHEQTHVEQLKRSYAPGRIKARQSYRLRKLGKGDEGMLTAAHYYGSTGEIMAWARQVAFELTQALGSKEQALALLKSNLKEAILLNGNLETYSYFITSHPKTWKRFMKQLTAYLGPD